MTSPKKREVTPFRMTLGQLPPLPSAQRQALANLGVLRWPVGATAAELRAARDAYHDRFEAEVARIHAEQRRAAA